MLDVLHIGEPNDVVLTGLKRDSTGAYKNDATVTAQIRTSGASSTSGTQVGSTRTLSYETGSDGNYRGTLTSDDTGSLTEGTTYYVWITSGDVTLRRIECQAAYRGKR